MTPSKTQNFPSVLTCPKVSVKGKIDLKIGLGDQFGFREGVRI